jgi:hypothetical protein
MGQILDFQFGFRVACTEFIEVSHTCTGEHTASNSFKMLDKPVDH